MDALAGSLYRRRVGKGGPWIAAGCIAGLVSAVACAKPGPCRYGDGDACMRACESDDPTSCTRLAAMYETGTVRGATGDAVREYLHACLLGDGLGCHMAGLKFLLGIGVVEDRTRALRAFDAACTLKYADGCAMKAALTDTGQLSVDVIEAYGRACDMGSALGCRMMGDVHMAAGNAAEARRYYQVACTRGDTAACQLKEQAVVAPPSSASASASAPAPAPAPPSASASASASAPAPPASASPPATP
jgi:hypothetical protein